MPLQLDDLAALDAPTLFVTGQALMLSADVIDENPDQPRHEVDSNALDELAETIRERGRGSRSRCAPT
jgi:ParB family chromosome partitioning protein